MSSSGHSSPLRRSPAATPGERTPVRMYPRGGSTGSIRPQPLVGNSSSGLGTPSRLIASLPASALSVEILQPLFKTPLASRTASRRGSAQFQAPPLAMGAAGNSILAQAAAALSVPSPRTLPEVTATPAYTDSEFTAQVADWSAHIKQKAAKPVQPAGVAPEDARNADGFTPRTAALLDRSWLLPQRMAKRQARLNPNSSNARAQFQTKEFREIFGKGKSYQHQPPTHMSVEGQGAGGHTIGVKLLSPSSEGLHPHLAKNPSTPTLSAAALAPKTPPSLRPLSLKHSRSEATLSASPPVRRHVDSKQMTPVQPVLVSKRMRQKQTKGGVEASVVERKKKGAVQESKEQPPRSPPLAPHPTSDTLIFADMTATKPQKRQLNKAASSTDVALSPTGSPPSTSLVPSTRTPHRLAPISALQAEEDRTDLLTVASDGPPSIRDVTYDDLLNTDDSDDGLDDDPTSAPIGAQPKRHKKTLEELRRDRALRLHKPGHLSASMLMLSGVPLPEWPHTVESEEDVEENEDMQGSVTSSSQSEAEGEGKDDKESKEQRRSRSVSPSKAPRPNPYAIAAMRQEGILRQLDPNPIDPLAPPETTSPSRRPSSALPTPAMAKSHLAPVDEERVKKLVEADVQASSGAHLRLSPPARSTPLHRSLTKSSIHFTTQDRLAVVQAENYLKRLAKEKLKHGITDEEGGAKLTEEQVLARLEQKRKEDEERIKRMTGGFRLLPSVVPDKRLAGKRQQEGIADIHAAKSLSELTPMQQKNLSDKDMDYFVQKEMEAALHGDGYGGTLEDLHAFQRSRGGGGTAPGTGGSREEPLSPSKGGTYRSPSSGGSAMAFSPKNANNNKAAPSTSSSSSGSHPAGGHKSPLPRTPSKLVADSSSSPSTSRPSSPIPRPSSLLHVTISEYDGAAAQHSDRSAPASGGSTGGSPGRFASSPELTPKSHAGDIKSEEDWNDELEKQVRQLMSEAEEAQEVAVAEEKQSSVSVSVTNRPAFSPSFKIRPAVAGGSTFPNPKPLPTVEPAHLRPPRALGSQVERWLRNHGQTVKRKLDPTELAKYRQIFALLDEDGSGTLSLSELQVALREIRVHMSLPELSQMANDIKAESLRSQSMRRRNLISFDEFVNGLARAGEWETLCRLAAIRKEAAKEKRKAKAKADRIQAAADRAKAEQAYEDALRRQAGESLLIRHDEHANPFTRHSSRSSLPRATSSTVSSNLVTARMPPGVGSGGEEGEEGDTQRSTASTTGVAPSPILTLPSRGVLRTSRSSVMLGQAPIIGGAGLVIDSVTGKHVPLPVIRLGVQDLQGHAKKKKKKNKRSSLGSVGYSSSDSSGSSQSESESDEQSSESSDDDALFRDPTQDDLPRTPRAASKSDAASAAGLVLANSKGNNANKRPATQSKGGDLLPFTMWVPAYNRWKKMLESMQIPQASDQQLQQWLQEERIGLPNEEEAHLLSPRSSLDGTELDSTPQSPEPTSSLAPRLTSILSPSSFVRKESSDGTVTLEWRLDHLPGGETPMPANSLAPSRAASLPPTRRGSRRASPLPRLTDTPTNNTLPNMALETADPVPTASSSASASTAAPSGQLSHFMLDPSIASSSQGLPFLWRQTQENVRVRRMEREARKAKEELEDLLAGEEAQRRGRGPALGRTRASASPESLVLEKVKRHARASQAHEELVRETESKRVTRDLFHQFHTRLARKKAKEQREKMEEKNKQEQLGAFTKGAKSKLMQGLDSSLALAAADCHSEDGRPGPLPELDFLGAARARANRLLFAHRLEQMQRNTHSLDSSPPQPLPAALGAVAKADAEVANPDEASIPSFSLRLGVDPSTLHHTQPKELNIVIALHEVEREHAQDRLEQEKLSALDKLEAERLMLEARTCALDIDMGSAVTGGRAADSIASKSADGDMGIVLPAADYTAFAALWSSAAKTIAASRNEVREIQRRDALARKREKEQQYQEQAKKAFGERILRDNAETQQLLVDSDSDSDAASSLSAAEYLALTEARRAAREAALEEQLLSRSAASPPDERIKRTSIVAGEEMRDSITAQIEQEEEKAST